MKHLFHISIVTLFFSVAGLFSGCFSRTTLKYKEFPELEHNFNAVLEEAELNEVEKAIRMKELEELEKALDTSYSINAGDVVFVIVYNHPELNIKTTVTPDGYIGMVFAGQVKVAGLSLEKAAHAIEEALEEYIRNPKVGISPVEILSENVTIAGAVAAPGMYTICNGMRLADLFAKAGGASIRRYENKDLEAADYDRSVFVRNNKTIPVDFNKAIKQGDRVHNILLCRGDYIYVAAKDSSMIFVVGDVRVPCRQIWNKDLDLLQALTIGGWMNETYWHHVIIIRGGIANPKLYKVDVDGILQGRRGNILVEAGDIIYVPKDDISEYNVFVRKLLPTGQLLRMLPIKF